MALRALHGGGQRRPAPRRAGQLPSGNLRLHIDKADFAPTVIHQFVPVFAVRRPGADHAGARRRCGLPLVRVRTRNSVRKSLGSQKFRGPRLCPADIAGPFLSSFDVFMQPHSYAVAPLTVNVARQDMGLRLQAPEQVLPGSALSVSLSARHPGKALIFAVDEACFSSPPSPRPILCVICSTTGRWKWGRGRCSICSCRITASSASGLRRRYGLVRRAVPQSLKRKAEPPLSWWSSIVEVGAGRPSPSPFPAITTPRSHHGGSGVAEYGRPRRNRPRCAARWFLTPQLPVLASPGDSSRPRLPSPTMQDSRLPLRWRCRLTGPARGFPPPPVEIAVGAGSR